MTSRVVFFSEGSANIGLGHITRCVSLAQAFAEHALPCRFVINGDAHVHQIRELENCDNMDWTHLADFACYLRPRDIAIVDSYLAPVECFERIIQTVALLLCVDDFFRIEYPPAAVILNGTFGIDAKAPDPLKERSLFGSRFIPLRKPFWDVPPRACGSCAGSVLVTFGGEDARGLTVPVVDALLHTFVDLEIHAVIGAAYHGGRPAAHPRLFLHHNLSAGEMCDLMLRCDLAVSAAGQTLYELARTGCPTVAVKIAENQHNNFLGALSLGVLDQQCGVDATILSRDSVIQSVLGAIQLLRCREKRTQLATNAQHHVDGQGARRVAKHVTSALS